MAFCNSRASSGSGTKSDITGSAGYGGVPPTYLSQGLQRCALLHTCNSGVIVQFPYTPRIYLTRQRYGTSTGTVPVRSRRCSTHRSTHPTASQRFPPPHEHPTHPPSEGGAAAAAPTPQHARICHSAIVSIPVASRQDTAVAGVRTPSIHENPHSLLIVSAGKTPPTCDEIVDLRPSACGHNKGPTRTSVPRASQGAHACCGRQSRACDGGGHQPRLLERYICGHNDYIRSTLR